MIPLISAVFQEMIYSISFVLFSFFIVGRCTVLKCCVRLPGARRGVNFEVILSATFISEKEKGSLLIST